MNARVRVLALGGALALAATTMLTACGGSEPAGDPSSFGEVSGSAVPVGDEITALCAEIVEQQLPLDAATALAEASGFTTRVIEIDGVGQPATADFREDRMNFATEADVVVECTTG